MMTCVDKAEIGGGRRCHVYLFSAAMTMDGSTEEKYYED